MPIHFLHLEDNDADAEYLEALLHREWPDCTIERMATREDFEAALARHNFDLVLSDHSMPNFDGFTALELARRSCPETPFIFLSGTIGEQRAIEALKRGAADYVLKDSPGRLIVAVRGAIADSAREAARRAAEESLHKSREQFRQIAESIDDFVVLLDAQGRCLYSNPAFDRLLRQAELAPDFSIFDSVHPFDRERFQADFDRAIHQSEPLDMACRLLLAEGVVRHLEAHASIPERRPDEAPTLLLAGRDITERRQAEEILIEQASLLGKARDAICVIDLQFGIVQWNASAERIYGHPATAALGRNVRSLLFKEAGSSFDAAFALTVAHGEWQGEFRLTHPEGRALIIDSSWSLVNDTQGRPKSILCIDTDVTSRKQLELELQRSQRIEGLGMLAGGIAHDLNNILSPIHLSVDLLRPLAPSLQGQRLLDALESSAEHGTNLVRQILLFARGEGGQRIEIQIGKLLSELKDFLKTSIRRTINLDMECAAGVWPILADATQLKQVLMNLCVNARDAMPDGGRLHITAGNIEVAQGAERAFHGEIPRGRYVRLSVADTGSGIPPEVLEKIFDPFFSTKGVGKGTGLGLSTIAGIVQNHEGAIQVESGRGLGTTFHIYLPARTLPPQAPVAEPPKSLPKGAGEVILVIDDDEGIRLVAEAILSSHGYTVLTADEGRTGLAEFQKERGRIQLVICDLVMPGFTGAYVLERIKREAPGVRLIAMSGLGEDLADGSYEVPSGVAVLTKPLKSEAFLGAVRKALDTASR